jgi:hypothetical protein
MNIKDAILFNVETKEERFLVEMAAEDLAKVLPNIKTGNYEQAAKDYIASMQGKNKSITAASVSKTLNSYLAKLDPEDKVKMEAPIAEFRKALTEVKRTENVTDNRPDKYDKSPTEVKVREKGEIVTKKLAQTGLTQRARKENLGERIAKEAELVKKELELIKLAADDKALMKLAKEIAIDLMGQKAPPDSTEEAVKNDIRTLKTFVNTGTEKAEALAVMGDIINQGYHNYEIFHQVVSNLVHVKPRTPEIEKKVQEIQKIVNAKKLAKQQNPSEADVKTLEYNKKYHIEHPGSHKKKEPEEVEEATDDISRAKEEGKCAYCGKKINVGDKLGFWNSNTMHYDCFMKRFRESARPNG